MGNGMHESSRTGDEFTTRLGRAFIALRRRPPTEQPAGRQALSGSPRLLSSIGDDSEQWTVRRPTDGRQQSDYQNSELQPSPRPLLLLLLRDAPQLCRRLVACSRVFSLENHRLLFDIEQFNADARDHSVTSHWNRLKEGWYNRVMAVIAKVFGVWLTPS